MPCLLPRIPLCLALAFGIAGTARLAANPVPQPPALLVAQAMQSVTPLGGSYVAQWADGTRLQQTIRVISPDMISLQRRDHATAPVLYHRITPGVFRNADGGTLSVLTATRLQWTGSRAGPVVTYERE